MSFDPKLSGTTIASAMVLSSALNGAFDTRTVIKAPIAKPVVSAKTSVQDVRSFGALSSFSQPSSADFARMQRVLAHFGATQFPSINVGQGSTTMSRMDIALEEIEQAVVAAGEDGDVTPRSEVVDVAKQIAELVVGLSPADLACEHNSKGGLEIFLKEDRNALLIAIGDDMSINVYGDDQKESWLAKYKADGRAWRRHIPDYIEEMSSI